MLGKCGHAPLPLPGATAAATQAVETEEEVMMLKLLKESGEEWAVRQRAPWRPWLWWAVDEFAEGRQKYQILQVR